MFWDQANMDCLLGLVWFYNGGMKIQTRYCNLNKLKVLHIYVTNIMYRYYNRVKCVVVKCCKIIKKALQKGTKCYTIMLLKIHKQLQNGINVVNKCCN